MKYQESYFNLIPDCVFYKKVDGTITWVNQAAIETTGLSREELIGSYCQDVWPSGAEKCKTCPTDKVRETKKAAEIEIELFDGDFYRVRAYPDFNEQGELIGILEIAENIDTEVSARDTIRETIYDLSTTQERMVSILNSIDALVYAVDIISGRVVFINGYGKEYFGNVINEYAYEVLAHENKSDYYRQPDYYDDRFYSFYHQDMFFQVREKLMDWLGGQQVKLVLGTDITNFVGVQKELIQEQEKFARYFNSAPFGIFLIDKEGDILEANPEASNITGYSQEELANLSGSKLMPQDKRDEYSDIIASTFERGTIEIDTQLICRNETHISVEINAVTLSEERILAFIDDISKRKMIERAVNKQWAYFKELFEGSLEAIALLDDRGRIIRINKSFREIFGYKIGEVEGRMIDDIIAPPNLKEEAEDLTQKIIAGEIYSGESIRMTKSGNKIDVAVKSFPIKHDDELIGIYAIYQDISARKREEEKTRYLSFHDQMTGLYNRRYFENELERLENSRIIPISIMIADLDGLKEINDNFGHSEGDRYIKKSAEIINSVTREEDVVARIGGDEFAIILPEAGNKAAQKIKRRIHQKCQEIDEDFGPKPVHISVGCATRTEADQPLWEIYKKADARMYQEKRERRK